VPPGRQAILLNPLGQVFGNGYHPSTRAFLEDLETLVVSGSLVVDVGTGSGVLAIATALLGAAKVYSMDTSPQALEVAVGNVRVSGVGSAVEVLSGTFPNTVRGIDLVLCNLGNDDLLPDIFSGAAELLRSGGLLAVVLNQAQASWLEAEALTRGLSKLRAAPVQDGWSYQVFQKEIQRG